MKYLRAFNLSDDYLEALKTGVFPKKTVIYLRDTDSVIYFRAEPESNVPLYIEALEDLTVSFSNATSYSLDGIAWVGLSASTATPVITTGQKVYFKASGLAASSSSGIGSFSMSGKCNVGGNAMSMIYGDSYENTTALTQSYALARLFRNCTSLVDARRLSLPATTLTTSCYRYMFSGCTSLVNAPWHLPATTLADNCYGNMFYNCTSLVNAPALPATTLAANCYQQMFSGCTSLVNAPALPATTLAANCYQYMFYNCTSLVNAPALPATTLATYCYQQMFQNCTSLVNAPALPATTLAANCYQQMFYKCTSLVNAPWHLPATTLADNCYQNMFNGCTSLVNAPALPATTLATYCYGNMFYNCTKLSYIKAMFTTVPSDSYTKNWVSGVAATGTFVKNAAATWNVTGVSGIPEGWTVETASA